MIFFISLIYFLFIISHLSSYIQPQLKQMKKLRHTKTNKQKPITGLAVPIINKCNRGQIAGRNMTETLPLDPSLRLCLPGPQGKTMGSG